ncbi:hypothetical protein D3C86_1720570 [compost metagenome]
MRQVDETRASSGQSQEAEILFDEEFLNQVDRAMLARRQADPSRLEEVRRAVEAESQLANLTNAYGIDRRSDRGRKEIG